MRSTKTLSRHAPLPSMLMEMLLAIRTRVKASLVNWLPWSVLKMSGVPCFARASSNASTQKAGSIVPAEPVDDGGEIDEAARHRDIGDVHRPDLVRTFDLQPAQKIGINLIPWRGLRRIRLTVDRFDPHALHQRGDMAAADLDTLAVQKVTQHPAPRERVFQMQLIHAPHEREILGRCRPGFIVHAAAADVQDLGLTGDG